MARLSLLIPSDYFTHLIQLESTMELSIQSTFFLRGRLSVHESSVKYLREDSFTFPP